MKGLRIGGATVTRSTPTHRRTRRHGGPTGAGWARSSASACATRRISRLRDRFAGGRLGRRGRLVARAEPGSRARRSCRPADECRSWPAETRASADSRAPPASRSRSTCRRRARGRARRPRRLWQQQHLSESCGRRAARWWSTRCQRAAAPGTAPSCRRRPDRIEQARTARDANGRSGQAARAIDARLIANPRRGARATIQADRVWHPARLGVSHRSWRWTSRWPRRCRRERHDVTSGFASRRSHASTDAELAARRREMSPTARQRSARVDLRGVSTSRPSAMP